MQAPPHNRVRWRLRDCRTVTTTTRLAVGASRRRDTSRRWPCSTWLSCSARILHERRAVSLNRRPAVSVIRCVSPTAPHGGITEGPSSSPTARTTGWPPPRPHSSPSGTLERGSLGRLTRAPFARVDSHVRGSCSNEARISKSGRGCRSPSHVGPSPQLVCRGMCHAPASPGTSPAFATARSDSTQGRGQTGASPPSVVGSP